MLFVAPADALSAYQGDFVDRGHYSLETVSLLLALKARYFVSRYGCGEGRRTLMTRSKIPGQGLAPAREPREQADHAGVRVLWCVALPLLLDSTDAGPDECQQKYGSATVWKACCNVFDYLNLAAVRVQAYAHFPSSQPHPRSSTERPYACTVASPPTYEH